MRQAETDHNLSGMSGFLGICKPGGMTSREVVNVLQRLVRPLKVGHAGTLDPLATGVLVVAVGPATRLIRYVQDQPKHYRGAFELGLTTDTDDITGRVLARRDVGVSLACVQDALAAFRGTIEQTPPQFSAVHVQGERAYALARRGQTVELAPRPVQVHSLDLVEFAPPRLVVDVVCGSGTYIRALGRDLGLRLGCGATMTALERRAVGDFTLDRAAPLAAVTRQTLREWLCPMAAAVAALPRVTLSLQGIHALCRGQSALVTADALSIPDGETAVFDDQGRLVAIAELAGGRLQPKLVLAPSARSARSTGD